MTAQRRSFVYAYSRRMPRMQVYLPEELYAAVKEHDMPASKLLQDAVRTDLRRRELIEGARSYLEELIDEVGEPSAEDLAAAETLSRVIRRGDADR